MSGVIERLGQYRLLNCVSAGQYSRMWEAIDDETRQHYGLKVLLPQFERDGNQISALRWEYHVGVKLDHANVIKTFRIASERRRVFLALEWFAAPNLKMLINRGYTQYAERLPDILALMATGLDYFHSQGWVHRDIKPDNFLCDITGEDGVQLKLIDFGMSRQEKTGIAKIFHRRTKTQGTASYLAPEQIRGEAPSPRVDIYGLGCAFFELLSGRLPFAGTSMNDLLQKHISAPPPPLVLRNRNILPEFSRLIQAMMAKKGDERPASMRDLVAAIRNTPIFRKPPSEEDII